MSDSTLIRIGRVIRDTFGDEEVVVTRETVAEDVAGWDSLSHTILMLALEDEFGVTLPPSTQGFANVGALVDVVTELTGS